MYKHLLWDAKPPKSGNCGVNLLLMYLEYKVISAQTCDVTKTYLSFRSGQLPFFFFQPHHRFNVFLQFADQISELQDDVCDTETDDSAEASTLPGVLSRLVLLMSVHT